MNGAIRITVQNEKGDDLIIDATSEEQAKDWLWETVKRHTRRGSYDTLRVNLYTTEEE